MPVPVQERPKNNLAINLSWVLQNRANMPPMNLGNHFTERIVNGRSSLEKRLGTTINERDGNNVDLTIEKRSIEEAYGDAFVTDEEEEFVFGSDNEGRDNGQVIITKSTPKTASILQKDTREVISIDDDEFDEFDDNFNDDLDELEKAGSLSKYFNKKKDERTPVVKQVFSKNSPLSVDNNNGLNSSIPVKEKIINNNIDNSISLNNERSIKKNNIPPNDMLDFDIDNFSDLESSSDENVFSSLEEDVKLISKPINGLTSFKSKLEKYKATPSDSDIIIPTVGKINSATTKSKTSAAPSTSNTTSAPPSTLNEINKSTPKSTMQQQNTPRAIGLLPKSTPKSTLQHPPIPNTTSPKNRSKPIKFPSTSTQEVILQTPLDYNRATSQPPSYPSSHPSSLPLPLDNFQLQAINGYQATIIKKLEKQVNLALGEIIRLRNEFPAGMNAKFDIDMDILSSELEGPQNKVLKIQEQYNDRVEMENESVSLSPTRDRKRRKVDNENQTSFNEDDIIDVSSDGEYDYDREKNDINDKEYNNNFNAYSDRNDNPVNHDYIDVDSDPPSSPKQSLVDQISDDESYPLDFGINTNTTTNNNDINIDSDSDIEMGQVIRHYKEEVDEDEVIEYDPYVVVNRSSPPPMDLPSQTQSQHVTQTQPTYAWTKEVFTSLKTTFHLTGFRQNQLEAINATLNGSDVLVLMPTGGGKSLCYQLPALISSGKTTGVTIVISPLLSLMQDQVNQLKEKNIRAEMINSQLSGDEKKHNRYLLFNNFLDLVYLSPELFRMSMMLTGLRRLHSKGQIARIVIDEAHCVSAWGHDFRPQYKELEMVKSEFPGVPIIALTATATNLVKVDIRKCLRDNCLEFKQTFNRPNLSYEVRRSSKSSKDNNSIPSIKAIMDKYKNQTGIIYCRTQNQCEELAKKLRQDNYLVDYYHGGLDTETRIRIQNQWQSGEIKAVCATIAFGMGIDKPDVRYVIHESMPRNMEGYYQETGRAGRDGKPSECIMFYSFHDYMTLMCAIDRDSELTYQRKEHQKQLLNSMIQYCENEIDCRRRIILSYFNEALPKSDICKKTCDNCKERSQKKITTVDITPLAKDLINLVSFVQKDKVTPLHIISVYKGSRIKKVIDLGHDNAPAFGNGKSKTSPELERIISHLVQRKILKDVPKANAFGGASATIYKGVEADRVLAGQLKVEMQFVNTKSSYRPNTNSNSNSNSTTKGASTSSRKRQFIDDNTQDDIAMFEDSQRARGKRPNTRSRQATNTKSTPRSKQTTKSSTSSTRPRNSNIRAMSP